MVDTGVQHALASGEYARRRQDCQAAASRLGLASLRELADQPEQDLNSLPLRPELLPRVRHVVSEIRRTQTAAEKLRHRDFAVLGQLLLESHESLRRDYEVSCEALDFLVDNAAELGPARGVWGSRMTGGGFGGCTLHLVQSGAAAAVQQELQRRYEKKTGRIPRAFRTRPAAGVRRLDF